MARKDDDEDTVAITKKGITTLYNGAQAIASINRSGYCRPLWRRQPRWSMINTVQFIEGKTLNRVHVVEQSKRYIRAYVRVLSNEQRKLQCDYCIRQHRPTNQRCSATLGLKSNASRELVLYDWATKRPAGRWKRVEWIIGGRDRVGVAEYVKM